MTDEERLQTLIDALLPIFDGMPGVKVRLFHAPYFDESNALAFWSNPEKTIYVRPDYQKRASYLSMVDTLTHELTHAWVSWQKDCKRCRHWQDEEIEGSEGHGRLFLDKAFYLKLEMRGVLHKYPQIREHWEQRCSSPFPVVYPWMYCPIHGSREMCPAPFIDGNRRLLENMEEMYGW